jgi:DNA-binding transcriptional MerR regulator
LDKAPDAFRTISEVAQELDLPQHVLRFWETRFSQIRPMKRGGGRRYYRPDDVDLLRGIRFLLYSEGYTIRGVQRLLKENGGRFVQSVWQSGTQDASDESDRAEQEHEHGGSAEAPAINGHLAESAASPSVAPSYESDEAMADDEAPARDGAQALQQPQQSLALDETPPRLAREDLRKLQAALFELGECRRLLEAALKDDM